MASARILRGGAKLCPPLVERVKSRAVCDSPAPGERLDRARAKAQQIDRLVTGLFDYARADIDERPRLQATDLAAMVNGATAAFELAAEEHGVKLQVTAHTCPSVTIDRDGLERALGNVLDNALRHTPRGGTVDVACGEDADHSFVRVIDDGPGIAPDLLPHCSS